MTENEQKQQLSVAYVHAVAARAGYACQATIVDDDSVDVTIAAKGRVHERSVTLLPRLEVQLKASSQNILRDDHITFPLPIKNYEELRCETMVPRLLIVFLLPDDQHDWLELTEEQMITRRCAYWRSLVGMPNTKNKTNVTVHLPRTNCLTVESLRTVMETVSRREPL
jgi:hypothetical protein